jgi:hypothetical protein
MTKRKSRLVEIQEWIGRRQDALKRWKQNPASAPELVAVLCKTCKRHIATPASERAKGEPPILLELVEDYQPDKWECYECAACPTCNAIVGCRCSETQVGAA